MTLLQDLDYTGRRVLVTGAANGFGAAMAQEFAAAGATMLMADIEREPLHAGAAALDAQPILFDQADPNSVAAMAEAAGAWWMCWSTTPASCWRNPSSTRMPRTCAAWWTSISSVPPSCCAQSAPAWWRAARA